MDSGTNGDRRPPQSPIGARRRFAAEVLQKAGQQGGLAFVLDGMEGTGKTFLLRELIDAASEDPRWQVTFVRADEIERNEPYSFIERFIASGVITDWFFTPDTSTDTIAVARECVRRMVGGGKSPDRVIVVDDAQWVDGESQRVLRYLLPRITGRRTLFAFGVRSPHLPGSFGGFLKDVALSNPRDVHHHLEPLSTAEIADLVLERHGAGISANTAQRILEATGGSFFGVDSVLSALSYREIEQLHLTWDAPIRMVVSEGAPLLHAFERLSPEAQRTCEVVCLAEHELTREGLAAAARRLGEPLALEEALAAKVLTESGFGSTILPRHTLLASAIRDALPAERARSVSRALAETTTGHRSFRHAIRGADSWDDGLRAQVHDYITGAVEKENPGHAIEVIRDALGIVDDPAARTELLESLALLHIQAKNAYLMLDLLDEIESLPPSVLHEFLSIVLSAHRAAQPLPLERVQRLLTAPAHTPDDRAVVAFFAFMVVLLTMRSPDRERVPPMIAHAKMLTELAPADAAELSDQRLAWMVSRDARLVVLDGYQMVQHQIAGEWDRVRALLPELQQRIDALPASSLKIDALVAVAGAKLALGELAEGRALAQRGVELLEQVGEPWAGGTARLIFADCLILQNDFAAASAYVESAADFTYRSLDVETRCSWAALRSIVSAVTGQDDAAVYAEQARRQRSFSWEGYGPDLTVLADCEVARAAGDPGAVLEATSGEWVERLVNTRHGFLGYRAHALLDLGRTDEAGALIADLASLRGDRWHEYWGTLDWLRARHAQALGDDSAAQWHYEAAIRERAFPLPLGLTLADFGEFLIGSGRAQEGGARLKSAVETLEQIGALGYLPRVRRGLEAESVAASAGGIGARLATLTPRELQIARQLAKGRSNNQIAESLLVSVTTVRSHVSSVLRKLHLSSRGEVVRLLAEDRADA